MIDTIVMTLESQDFKICKPELFTPSADIILKGRFFLNKKGSFSCTQNPSSYDLKKGRYKPRLTFTCHKVRGGLRKVLRIEFSAPKLLFGNNFEELTNEHCEQVLKVLQATLKRMGVETSLKALQMASIAAIHYSKNIIFPPHTTSSMIISELAKANPSQHLDICQTDYVNGGHSLRFHANSYELILYDKVKDLQKAKRSGKRAIEEDNLSCGIDIPKGMEVFRLELRLNHRDKIKNELRKHGYSVPLTFQTLFKSEIARSLLVDYWEALMSALPLLAMTQDAPEDLFRMTKRDAALKDAKALQLLGYLLIEKSVGCRPLRDMVDQKVERSCRNLKKKLASLELQQNYKAGEFADIKRKLIAFIPLTKRIIGLHNVEQKELFL